jgi:ubiquitin-conjugating enzyme E2 Z
MYIYKNKYKEYKNKYIKNIYFMSNNFVSKDCIQRLIKDVKDIIKNPLEDNGIYYKHDEEDMLKGYALIIGPSETIYFGGFYFFELKYPTDYPYSPPKVKYYTNGEEIRFNPNLYKCGKVCISILNTWSGDQWTSSQTISTVLLNLCTLFCKNPLLNEPGIKNTHPDIINYEKIIEYANLNIAICDIVLSTSTFEKTDELNSLKINDFSFLSFFSFFQTIIKDNFKKNIDIFLSLAEEKRKVNPETLLVKTNLYSMNVYIDYKKVIQKLEFLKKKMDL